MELVGKSTWVDLQRAVLLERGADGRAELLDHVKALKALHQAHVADRVAREVGLERGLGAELRGLAPPREAPAVL